MRLSISPDRAAMFFCAASITARRSCSCFSDWPVRSAWSVRLRPRRSVTWSSRSSSVATIWICEPCDLLDEALQRAGEFGDAVFELGRAALGGESLAAAAGLRPP